MSNLFPPPPKEMAIIVQDRRIKDSIVRVLGPGDQPPMFCPMGLRILPFGKERERRGLRVVYLERCRGRQGLECKWGLA